jgi:DNA-damage-inducible protein J
LFQIDKWLDILYNTSKEVYGEKMIKSTRKQTSIKVDPIAWNSAKEIFEGYGISVSDAINIFLHKVQKVGGLPFEMRDDEYYYTPKEQILEDLKEAIKEVNLANEGKHELLDARKLLNEL